jgi:hypothetical protein
MGEDLHVRQDLVADDIARSGPPSNRAIVPTTTTAWIKSNAGQSYPGTVPCATPGGLVSNVVKEYMFHDRPVAGRSTTSAGSSPFGNPQRSFAGRAERHLGIVRRALRAAVTRGVLERRQLARSAVA